MRAFIRAFVVLLVLVAVLGGAVAYTVVRRGLSTREEPSRMEAWVARAMRRAATPSTLRAMTNPVEPTHDVLEEGLEHFADHCASCHANNGSGDTEVGRGLYPRAPDMRADSTQQLSDGELFSIIENGIRLTGMPAWGTGTAEGERASWALVHFVRRLPKLSEDEIARMEQLNPRPADQWREEEEARRFLAGEDSQPASTPPPAHRHDGEKR